VHSDESGQLGRSRQIASRTKLSGYFIPPERKSPFNGIKGQERSGKWLIPSALISIIASEAELSRSYEIFTPLILQCHSVPVDDQRRKLITPKSKRGSFCGSVSQSLGL
jgi:hypothetical protein